jgi:hypothetical protein
MERLLGLVTDGELKIAHKIYHDASDDMHRLANTAAAIRAFEMDLVACLSGAETGVLSTDAPLETLGVRSNGTANRWRKGTLFTWRKGEGARIESCAEIEGQQMVGCDRIPCRTQT